MSGLPFPPIARFMRCCLLTGFAAICLGVGCLACCLARARLAAHFGQDYGNPSAKIDIFFHTTTGYGKISVSERKGVCSCFRHQAKNERRQAGCRRRPIRVHSFASGRQVAEATNSCSFVVKKTFSWFTFHQCAETVVFHVFSFGGW